MAVRRYWRLKSQTTGEGQSGMGQIIMADSPGGAQLCVGGTAIASGSYGGGLAPGQSFTGVAGDNWFSSGASGPWIGYDFGPGVEHEINELRLTGAPSSMNGTLRIFDVESSPDGVAWDFEWSGYYTAWADGSTYITFSRPEVAAANRYWSILSFNTFNGGGDLVLAELEFRDTPGGPTVTGSGVGDYYPANGGYPVANAYDNNLATIIYAGVTGRSVLVSYDFGTPEAIVEIAPISALTDGNEARAPVSGRLMASPDGRNWFKCGELITGAWTPGETKTFEVEIIGGPPQQVSEARVFSVFSGLTSAQRISEARVFSVYNFPTPELQISQYRSIVTVKRASKMDVSHARIFAIVRGRVDNPRIRAWTFTLDGHDFYVIRLGDGATLLYDVYSEQWVDWDSAENGAWRPNTGITWPGAAALADTFGSSIVAGDDTFGLLWFLDPELAWDENPDPARPRQEIEFERIVTGQVLASGRQYMPCFAVFVDGDNYGLSGTEFTPTVLLEYSDDQGRNFEAADTLTVETDLTVDNPYAWYSLGQISSPGRIFRVRDNGVFARIDSMDMNDDAG